MMAFFFIDNHLRYIGKHKSNRKGKDAPTGLNLTDTIGGTDVYWIKLRYQIQT